MRSVGLLVLKLPERVAPTSVVLPTWTKASEIDVQGFTSLAEARATPHLHISEAFKVTEQQVIEETELIHILLSASHWAYIDGLTAQGNRHRRHHASEMALEAKAIRFPTKETRQKVTLHSPIAPHGIKTSASTPRSHSAITAAAPTGS